MITFLVCLTISDDEFVHLFYPLFPCPAPANGTTVKPRRKSKPGNETSPKWSHAAYVNRLAKNARLYLNGEFKAQVSSLDGAHPRLSEITFGDSNTEEKVGDVGLDEIRLYNRALSAEQVQMDMNTAAALDMPESICL
jgi:hypothetical protein